MKHMICRSSSLEIDTRVEHLVKHYGEFQGSALDFLSLEVYVSRYWTREQIKIGIERTQQTWFDYRMIHPAMRVLHFAHEYARARERAFHHHYGRSKAQSPVNPYSKRSLRSGSTALLINTMHIVDQMKMPYPLFFDAVIEALLQKHGYTKDWDSTGWAAAADGVPLLGHMRHGQSVIAAQRAFEERCRTRMPLPKHPSYRMKNWAGTPAQKDCVAWFCSEAKHRRETERPYVLKRMIEDDFLNEREVLRRFGADMVKTIRAIV